MKIFKFEIYFKKQFSSKNNWGGRRGIDWGKKKNFKKNEIFF